GSSSVKFTALDMQGNAEMASGVVERIGLDNPQLSYANSRGNHIERQVSVSDVRNAMGIIIECLTNKEYGVVKINQEIEAVGHRVVHGGEKITEPVIVTDMIKSVIAEYGELAPLHNPPNLKGIKACEEIFPHAQQVAVFDTAFHTTIPEHAFLYGLPYSLYTQDRIRRYGFHGISHKYVSRQAAGYIGQPIEKLKIITCHLGNGCSITAVDGGRSVDTSMGFTPLEGLIMGTRCGDIDPAIVFYLMEHKKLDNLQVSELLLKHSGMLGLANIGSNDLRDIINARDKGDPQADIALRAFAYRIKKYIGSYMAAMGGLDMLVFTAGIGENSPLIRSMACKELDGQNALGIMLDDEKNADGNRKLCAIHHDTSRVKVLVVPTNEEYEIANETLHVVQNRDRIRT
ncbi:MAG: acetate kinase, partial [Deltaproteobacteria bacterium]|nr:acetate kinase [Deltaproteobacteria bacterium]